MEKYSYAVFIGRFQPFHNAHLEVALKALEIAEDLIIVIGSANAAPSIKNPFSFDERKAMIQSCLQNSLSTQDARRVKFVPVRDYFHSDNTWLADVQHKTSELMGSGEHSVTLVGSYKDESSFYLKMFPQWDFTPSRQASMQDATDVRRAMLWNPQELKDSKTWQDALLDWRQMVPPSVSNWLENNFIGTEKHQNLKEEFAQIEKYKELWKVAPFPPTFVTVDAVVVQSGHVLLVKRKFAPGKGLLALPGGFIKASERIEVSCIRELKEETGIRVAQPILKSSIKESKVFDFPYRSLRGRTITHAYYIKLPDGELPEVKGSDDAEKAFWLPLMDVGKRENEFFEDHCAIISYFMGR